jgi:hypothetical protein
MRSRCCLCVCVFVPVFPSMVARQQLGRNRLTVAKQRHGTSLLMVARQRLGRNVAMVTNRHVTKEELLHASFSM